MINSPDDKGTTSTAADASSIPRPMPPPEPPEPPIVSLPVCVPHDMNDPTLWREATRFQLIYSLAGLLLGLACIVGGVILFLRGITGSTSWTAKVIGLESNISDAAPGVVLFIVGLFIVFVTKYSVI